MQLTTNYKLKKPGETDVINIEDFNDNIETLDGKLKEIETEVSATKKSVSDGKAEIAAAITQKKIPTAADATFSQMATNIKNIISGSGNATAADVLAGKTFTNSTGIEQTGTIPSKGTATITPGKTNQTIAAGQYLSGTQTIASLGGNATAAQVLSGYTFSSDAAGRGVGGGIVNRGAPGYSLPINGTQWLPEGYYSGGHVTQNVATHGGQTITPSKSQQYVDTAWKYCTGNVIINPIPSNYYNANENQLLFGDGAFGAMANHGMKMGVQCGFYQLQYSTYLSIFDVSNRTVKSPVIKDNGWMYFEVTRERHCGGIFRGSLDLSPYKAIVADLYFVNMPNLGGVLTIGAYDTHIISKSQDSDGSIRRTEHMPLAAEEYILSNYGSAGEHVTISLNISKVTKHTYIGMSLTTMSAAGCFVALKKLYLLH